MWRWSDVRQAKPSSCSTEDSVTNSAPFCVTGLQQFWKDDSLVLYICAVPPEETRSPRTKLRVRIIVQTQFSTFSCVLIHSVWIFVMLFICFTFSGRTWRGAGHHSVSECQNSWLRLSWGQWHPGCQSLTTYWNSKLILQLSLCPLQGLNALSQLALTKRSD